MSEQIIPVTLGQGLPLLLFIGAGLVYATWFKRARAAFGFLFLFWFAVGLIANPVAEALGIPLEHDLAGVAYRWLPFNLCILALLPLAWPMSVAGAAVTFMLFLQLLIPIFVPIDSWAGLPSVNERLAELLPAYTHDLLLPIEPIVTVIAAIAFFLRWQFTVRTTEVSLSLMCSVLLVGIMRVELLIVVAAVAAGVVFLAVIYNSHRMAFVDALTGLANRRSLDLALAHPQRKVAIAMLDIDRFKRINDRFGHDLGDQVLRMVASRLRRIAGFKPFRYGGEEFCLVFKGKSVDRVEEICEAVRAAIADPPLAIRSPSRPAHRPLNREKYREKVPALRVTASLGIALPRDGEPISEVIANADEALYKAKRAGRNKVVMAK